MRAVAYRLRCMLRREWRASVWLALVIAVTTSAVLLIAAGAQRTSSAPDRYTAGVGRRLDVVIMQEGGRSRALEVRALPGAATVDAVTFVFGGVLQPGGTDPIEALVFSGSAVATGAQLVDGRLPDDAREAEFVATRSFADATGAQIGDEFQLLTLNQDQADRFGFDVTEPAGPTLGAVLVGVVDSPDEIDFPTPSVVFSPALLDRHADIGVSATNMAVGLRPGFDITEFRDQLDTLDGGRAMVLEPGVVVSETIRTAVDAQGTGLWLLAGVAAVATVAVLGQLISRQVRVSVAERMRLSALGFSDGQIVLESAGRQAVPIVGGLVVGVVLAVLASGLFPRGFVRRIELEPGLRVETVVLVVGALALLLALLAWTLAAAVMTRSSSHARLPSRAVEAIATRSGSAALATGMRFAFTRRLQERGSARTAVVGASLIAVGVVGALTFATSLDRLVTEPARWGNRYDHAFGSGGEGLREEVRTALAADPDVSALTLFAAGGVRIGEESLELVGVEQVSGSISAPLLSGRLPASEDEVALGRLTADDLDLRVGDVLVVDGPDGPEELRVSGVVVVPSVEGVDGVGRGGLVPLSSLTRLVPSAAATMAAIDLRAGAPGGTPERLSELTGMATGPPTPPSAIVSVSRVRSIPFVLASLLGVLAVVSVGHVMLSSVQGRRRDIAILRAIGADRRWIGRVVHWQATSFTVLAVAIGVPLGIAVGRVVFVRFADGIGTVDDPATPLAVVAGVVLGLVALANLIAAVPSRRARRLEHATVLRAD